MSGRKLREPKLPKNRSGKRGSQLNGLNKTDRNITIGINRNWPNDPTYLQHFNRCNNDCVGRFESCCNDESACNYIPGQCNPDDHCSCYCSYPAAWPCYREDDNWPGYFCA